MKRIFFFLTVMAATINAQEFEDYRMRYDHYAEGDSSAFRHVRPYIAKAKKEKNFKELAQGYKDAVSFSPDRKMAYADSMIWAASQTGSKDLTATAYLTKGTVYYFNYSKFKPALDEYLKAWQYSQHSADRYLHNKNLYHIGVVKSYLGYDAEALEIFTHCEDYFGKAQETPEPPNIKFNRKKGYLNTLHQKGICLVHLHRWAEAEQLTDRALSESGAEADFYLEKSYFYKLKGIIAYRQKRDSLAVTLLSTSLAGFEKKNDFINASLAYYYRGKASLRMRRKAEAMVDFQKIDSIFRLHSFMLPEVRNAYELLIAHYHSIGRQREELYYTTQLLKADHIISTDFKYLAEKIYKEYDTQDLLKAKRRLETSAHCLYIMIGSLISAFAGLLVYLYRKKQSEKALFRKYQTLLIKAEEAQQGTEDTLLHNRRDYKISDRSLINLLQKLETFEKSRLFLEKGLTRHALSVTLETNDSYLSQVINRYKGNNFNGYLNGLRIQHITELLSESSKPRGYSLAALAEECGFSDRTKFSRAFTEINGVSPTEFISQLNRSF